MSEPLVSVITPAYNAEKFIGQTIESVLAQTYKNWEMLIVDDGSIDFTKEIVRVYAKNDNRIKLFSHPGNKNKGVSATRNLAVENSKGDYLAMLDSDDLWVPYKLELQLQQFQENESAGVVYSKAICIDEYNRFLTDKNKYDFPSILESGTSGLSETMVTNVELMLKDNLFMPCLTVLIKKEAMGCLRFEENLKYQIEDHFIFTLIASRHPIYYYDAPLAFYRVHSHSYTTNTNWQLSHIEYLKKIGRYLPDNYLSIIEDELNKRKLGLTKVNKYFQNLKMKLLK